MKEPVSLDLIYIYVFEYSEKRKVATNFHHRYCMTRILL